MRFALTALLAACLALAGCVLAEGKLLPPASADAGSKPAGRDARRIENNVATVDAAIKERDAHVSGSGGTGGAAGDPREAGSGGTGVRTDDDDDAGLSTAPKANGEACDESYECASGNCKMSRDGQRCYGLIAVDRACSGMYDCDGYACIPVTADGKNSVCVDTSECGTQDRCSQEYWAATCQLDQLCSEQSSSFNQCYQEACKRPRDSGDLCLSQLAITNGLIASRCCPPAGAFHSSCDPAPQCGCQDGQKCDVRGIDGQTSCGPVGSVPELEACDSNSDCMVGYVCTTHGCRRYCDGPGDRLCSNAACKPIKIQGFEAPGGFVCSRTCDPTSPESANGPFGACGSGQRCEPAPDGNSDCYEGGGSGRQGASCNMSATANNQACAPGFVCVAGTLTCEQYCKVAANDCEVGTCEPDLEKKYAYDTEIGHCKLP